MNRSALFLSALALGLGGCAQAIFPATLATWFGVSAANLPSFFPNLAHFPTSSLGFLG